uniref:Transmembrane protein n=1 Tax=Globodera rostochiensis TaxID=31243 RepID=A0A914GW08_GLORO
MSTLSVGGDSQKHNGTSGVHAAAQQQQMTAMAAAVPVVAAANGRNFGFFVRIYLVGILSGHFFLEPCPTIFLDCMKSSGCTRERGARCATAGFSNARAVFACATLQISV